MRLQYLDEAQNGIFDVCFPSTNPMGELHAKYADMLNSPILEGPLKALVHHFLLAGTEVYTNIINNGRRLACAIDSQVWFWMDPAADFPNRWAAAVDTRRTTMEQNVIWKDGVGTKHLLSGSFFSAENYVTLTSRFNSSKLANASDQGQRSLARLAV